MLASEFIAVVQEAGFPWEKITEKDLDHQPNGVILTSPGIRVKTGNTTHLWSLKNISDMTKDELTQIYKQKAELETDFAAIPEKG